MNFSEILDKFNGFHNDINIIKIRFEDEKKNLNLNII